MHKILTSRVEGSGPTLVLLNGGLMSISSWDEIATPLLTRFELVRFDFRGQLLSPGLSAQSMLDHANDVVRLLDSLEIEKAHFFGTSFGAEVAILVAGQYPDRVSSLAVLTATDRVTETMRIDGDRLEGVATAAAEGRGEGSEILRTLAPNTFSRNWLDRQHPNWLEQRAALMGSFPREWFAGVASMMRAIKHLDLSAALPRVVAPTLVIAAELDRTFPLEHSRALAEAIPNARLEIIEGVGHAAVLEAPSTVRTLLESWLDERDVRSKE